MRGARQEARGARGCAAQAAEAHGATIRCTVVGRPALVASFLSPRPTRAQPRCAPIIPFIAGQWSLRGGDAAWQRHAPRGRSRAAPRSFPSLRGSGRFAVATRRGSATPHAGAAALRPYHYPLHCGAVVASSIPPGCRTHARHVSIPFIAGQWSLLGVRVRLRHVWVLREPMWVNEWSLLGVRVRLRHPPVFQSPSLRGLGADRTGVSHACCFLRLRPAGAHACRPGRCGTPGWRRVGRTANTRSTNLVHRSGPTPR
jgi:hypothetical protein